MPRFANNDKERLTPVKAKENIATNKAPPPQQRTWHESYLLLKAYYETHGDTLVPVYYKEDSALGK